MDLQRVQSRQSGQLTAFSVTVILTAAVLGAAGASLGVNPVLLVALILVGAFAATMIVRHRRIGRWGFRRVTLGGEHDGRQVELDFDERLVVLNRLGLRVDGKTADRATIWYGAKELTGPGVAVAVGSGWVGQCTGAIAEFDVGRDRPPATLELHPVG